MYATLDGNGHSIANGILYAQPATWGEGSLSGKTAVFQEFYWGTAQYSVYGVENSIRARQEPYREQTGVVSRIARGKWRTRCRELKTCT